MRINNITPQINFKQVIRIKTSTDEYYNSHNYETANKELANVLNNKKSSLYSQNEAEQIKNFFNQILGKDNKKVAFQEHYSKKFLTTGEHTKDINDLKKFETQMLAIQAPQIQRVTSRNIAHSLQNLKMDTKIYSVEILDDIFAYADSKSYITIKKEPTEERFSFFEFKKQNTDGKIETKSLNLNA